ncbi:MAG: F0F1 ATP synthase subunit B [Chloroflexi bacterium]|nr:F0F1 ATP synthase subunit B [Chloroflexota bacterium]
MQVLETLGLNLPGFLWHGANFLVLVFLLSRFLYRPVVQMLDERAARVKESMERAEFVRQEAERAEEQRTALMAQARRDLEELRTQAERQLEAYRSQRRQEIEAEIQRMVGRAEADLSARQEQMMAELRAQVAALAVAAAERVIRQRMDGELQRRLVEEFLAEQPAGNGAR